MTVHLRSRRKRLGAATVLISTLVAGSLALATPANAATYDFIDHPDYANQIYWNEVAVPNLDAGKTHHLGNLVVTLKPGAKATDQYPFASVATAPDARPLPTGVSWLTVSEQFIWDAREDTASSAAWGPGSAEVVARGLNTFPFSYTDSEERHIAGARLISSRYNQTQTGYFRFVIGYGSGPLGPRPSNEGAYFYDALLKVDKATGELSVVSDAPSEDKAETTTALTSSNVTATSATLTASVTPAEATGTVTFKNGDATVGTAELSGGSASVDVTGLAPNLAHTFTAEYAGDETHEASTGTVSITTLPATDSSDSDVVVVVPPAESTDPTGLKMLTKPGEVTLSGGARLEGSPWTASGALGDVVVNDDRQDAAAQSWTLSGRATAFSGAGSIPASALSWKDATGGTGFQAGTLDQARTLSTGTASAEANQRTTITGTQLELVVPADAPAGDYTATLSLTLI